MEYDFAYEQLSPDGFESLAVSLAESVIGSGVQAYGPGPDGGRDATYTGPLDWSATTDQSDQAWNGYVVVQAKQCQTPSTPAANLAWLKSQLAAELGRWIDPSSRRRQRFPQYLLVVTNVGLSGADPGGGIDELREWVKTTLDTVYEFDGGSISRSLRGCGLREAKVWHRADLNMLLTGRDGIRKRFAPLMTLGDVLTRLERIDTLLPGLIPHDHLAHVLQDHARETLKGERWARFDEAGDDLNRRSFERVVFDLPVKTAQQRLASVLRLVLERGDQVLRPSVPRPSGAHSEVPVPRHLVITGAPGNGKSTLVKYLTQVYRVGFLQAGPDDARESNLSKTRPAAPVSHLLVHCADDSSARAESVLVPIHHTVRRPHGQVRRTR